MSEASPDLTRLLRAACSGEERALEELTPLVYEELHRLARVHMRKESAGHTLQTTALVHEAFVKLVRSEVDWQDRVHFFSLASRLMRHILVDHAKARRAQKRGGASDPLPLDEAIVGRTDRGWDLVDLALALDKLGTFEPRQVRALELRFFGGLTNEEVARALEVSVTTARSEMRLARAWLRRELAAGRGGAPAD